MAKPTYNIAGLANAKPGATQENSSGEKAVAGLWRHPESGEEAGTLYDPLFGDVQSEAFKRLGFVRVGDLPEDYVKTVADVATAPAAGSDEELRGLRARLRVLEDANHTAQTKSDLDNAGRYDPANPRDATDVSGEQAKANAVAAHNSRDQGPELELTPTGDMQPVASTTEAPAVSDKALSKQNKTELLATATAEGVEGVSSDNSNKEIVSAIEMNRTKPVVGEAQESEKV